MRNPFVPCLMLLLWVISGSAHADARGRAAAETAEYVVRRFGRQAAKEGSDVLARKIETYAARHGDEFVEAVRKVGPRAFPLVEGAGQQGRQAARVLARHGETAAAWVVSRPQGMALFLKHGDACAGVLCRHPGIAEPVVERFGTPAVEALGAVGPQAGRRLAMLAEGGELARIGHADELLRVVGKYGDKAMEFIWKNKGALTVSAALVAFLADPEPFVMGTRDLAAVVGESAVRPLAEVPGKAVEKAVEQAAPRLGRRTNGTLFLLALLAAVALVVWWRRRRVLLVAAVSPVSHPPSS